MIKKIHLIHRTATRVLVLFASLCGATPGHADTAVCIGKLTAVGNHGNGMNGLWVAVGTNSIVKVCSFTATQFSVTPDDCKHMASLAAVAFATDTDVVFYIDNAPSTTCASVPSWHIAETRYFALSK